MAVCATPGNGTQVSQLRVLGEGLPDAAAHPYLAVIVKPTYDCNLACDYCSVYGCEAAPRMSPATVDTIIDRVAEFCGTSRAIFLIWHGGEPLLLSPGFYDHIGRRTSEYKNHSIQNAVQTNGTLLNEEYLEVFRKYGFDISISLDGPERLHDAGRKDRNGNGSFQTVMQAVSLLRSTNVPVGAVAVLTRQNLGRMREIYEFFNGEGIHLRINPVQKQGRADTAYDRLSIQPRRYGKEMIELFDLWYSDQDTRIVVDPLRIIMGNILDKTPDCCDFRRQCHAEIISIGPSGEVYPCGQFNGFEEYYFGNIHRDTLGGMMQSAAALGLFQRVPERIPRCRKCEFRTICNCGCTVSALIHRGRIMDPDFYCVGRKMLFRHILRTLETDVSRATKLVKDRKAAGATRAAV